MTRDRLTRERRSWNMSRIRGKDTTLEKAVRSMLHCFRLNVKIPIELPAKKSTGERDSVEP
jgi:G:T-mismatch repair DNA endonuclease (very short patch repair protein)